MATKMPPRDPMRAHARKVIAARRVGEGKKCSCGEDRPGALIGGSNPTECFECERVRHGRSTQDAHHVAGSANDPITIDIPVNDHRACLSDDQYDWPKDTLQNPDASPLLAGAAQARGYVDTSRYLQEKLLLRNAEIFECLDKFMVEKFGPKWWHNTPLEQYAPKPKRAV
jgi:hypothetical protein